MKLFWILDFGFSIGKPQRKEIFCLALSALLFLLCCSAQAQQPKKIPRIGVLVASSASAASQRIKALQQGLRDLGYIER